MMCAYLCIAVAWFCVGTINRLGADEEERREGARAQLVALVWPAFALVTVVRWIPRAARAVRSYAVDTVRLAKERT